jgi:nucleotide-binding universal stress UspA family protein
MGRIVVGVDGSSDSKAALQWAVDEARRRGDEVIPVYVYGLSDEHNPFLAAYASFASTSSAEQTAKDAMRWQEERGEATHRQAQGVVTSLVREVAGENPDVTVTPIAVPGGRPARALLERSRECSMLVVGARGRGGFRGLRLGSVAEKCVRHADCSVMVIRGKG